VDSLEQSAAACAAAYRMEGSWFIWSLGGGELIYLLQPTDFACLRDWVAKDYINLLH
jgi:hypothetical protein